MAISDTFGKDNFIFKREGSLKTKLNYKGSNINFLFSLNGKGDTSLNIRVQKMYNLS